MGTGELKLDFCEGFHLHNWPIGFRKLETFKLVIEHQQAM
jgi:hypothetical protein